MPVETSSMVLITVFLVLHFDLIVGDGAKTKERGKKEMDLPCGFVRVKTDHAITLFLDRLVVIIGCV